MNDAVLAGSGSLIASAQMALTASGVFAGSGSLRATGTILIQVKPVFSGVGSLVTNLLLISSQATFLGVGSFSALAQVLKFATAPLNGSGKLCAQATVRLGSSFGAIPNLVVSGPGATQNVVV